MLQGEIRELVLTTSREIRLIDDLIETFKINNAIPNYARHFFNIPYRTANLLSTKILKLISTNHLDFFANGVIHFGNKLPKSDKK